MMSMTVAFAGNEDNNSTNGTIINGKPLIHSVELKNNDMLTLGDQSIRINM